MVFFSIIRDSEQNDQISHFKVFGSKSMPKHMLIFILVKKYLKYTLHALNIPMTSKHDTMTIFTTLCMYKVDISKLHEEADAFFLILLEPPSEVGRMSDNK